MTIWVKKGVQGDLAPVAQKGFGRVCRAIEDRGKDVFVTSIRDGNHMPGSFHDIGLAFDIDYPKGWNTGLKIAIEEAAGKGWQFIYHKTHIHAEYDTV